MSDIHVKDENPLYELKDLVVGKLGEVEDAQRSLSERTDTVVGDVTAQATSLQEQKDLLESVNVRLDKMDDLLPKGGKDYIPALSAEQTQIKKQCFLMI